MKELLTPERAFLFRITHRDNVSHLLANGVHCRNSLTVNPNYVEIGHPDIIGRRATRIVPVAPGGALADYVPFYFTPCSPMLHNVVTGRNGLKQRARSEVIILVTSFDRLEEAGSAVVVADRNATLDHAEIRPGRQLFPALPWTDWQSRDYRHDPDSPGKFERYQAEGLVHDALPVDALLGIITYDDRAKVMVDRTVATQGLSIPVHIRSQWYP